jgi:prevent-host-death family protein
MNEVGIRALKAQLSAHLERVQAGVRLTVTDRGRAIATIVPIRTMKDPAWARRMVAEGLAKWGGGKPVGLHPRVQSKGTPTSRLVIEDRR